MSPPGVSTAAPATVDPAAATSSDAWLLGELYHLQGAVRRSISDGSSWLVSRIHPGGPILAEERLNLIYKGVWGLHDAGVDASILDRAFRWIERALKPNGDFYFASEPEGERIGLRSYRPLTFLKVAAWIDDPLASNELVSDRIMEYQHPSGGVYDYIGEERGVVETPLTRFTVLNTSFFGHLMIALDRREPAIAAGAWLRRYVEANARYMRDEDILFTRTTIEGEPDTTIDRDDALTTAINLVDRKQEFWLIGTVTAYLAVLYDTMRQRWGADADEAAPFLDAANEVLRFEARMPEYTYLWPSKCKVAWGAGELLRVLVTYGLGTPEQVDDAYRATRNTAVITFIENQLPSGGWYGEHYVTSKSDPEYRFEYKPLKGVVNVPPDPIPGSSAGFISAEEITGEFLGELKAADRGLTALIGRYSGADGQA